MNYKIDNDVKMPAANRKTKYPFADLDIGQSFHVDGDDKEVGSLRSAASWYGKRNNKKFRVIGDKSGGARCWRVTNE